MSLTTVTEPAATGPGSDVLDGVSDDVSARIAKLAGALNLTNFALVATMADVLESGGWAGPGIHSPAQWLAWKAGVTPQRTRS